MGVLASAGAIEDRVPQVVEEKLFRTEAFAVTPFGRSNLPAGVRVDNPGVYENSRYAYLHEVLIRRRGLPCTLAILYNAVCQRLLASGALPCAVRIDCSALYTWVQARLTSQWCYGRDVCLLMVLRF
jgi:Transglutaminase-like superfamily